MNDNNSDFDLSLWLKWTLANAAGQAMAGTCSCATAWYMASNITTTGSNWEAFFNIVVFGTVIGTVVGATVGTMQAIILSDKGIPRKQWVLASTVGGAVGWTFFFILVSILFTSQIAWD